MLTAVLIAALTTTPGDRWPAFRGDGTSLSAATKLPTEWNDTTNIAWSVSIPGYGQSSPVVWGDRVFVTSADGEEKDRLLVSCFTMATGEKLWTKEFSGTQKVKVSDYVSRGAPTPVVDAERVYAFFESGDLVALSHA
ncbi:MAG: pyrrolo-quinoline quinone, partial [Planctomycetales bacterium 12-60-4]